MKDKELSYNQRKHEPTLFIYVEEEEQQLTYNEHHYCVRSSQH